ncbi:hypothetical protein M9H77_04638 [Catharanthus roseus]|uniref:Uncharacterized protein n=1 Tax=Catharanthus roseus TaxID=4058 RepID=A0ACC0CES6_CATRO|nr:hypothetical protein M9H77_04638 [Catharanthus roseus]
MHRSRAPYRCGLFKTVYNCCKTGFGRIQSYGSGYDLVFGSVRGLHCTWLVPRMRASSDGVDDLDSGEWIHLKRGVDRRGCGPIDLRGHRIMLCGGLHRCVLIRSDFLAALETLIPTRAMYKVLLFIWGFVGIRLLFCIAIVLRMVTGLFKFFRCIFCVYTFSVSPGLGTFPRGTQIPYLVAVDLVAGLGVSQVVSECLGLFLGLNCWILDKL